MCLRSALDEAPVRALRAVLASPAWCEQLDALPGYRRSRPGEVLSLRAELPWWRLRRKREAPPQAGSTGP